MQRGLPDTVVIMLHSNAPGPAGVTVTMHTFLGPFKYVRVPGKAVSLQYAVLQRSLQACILYKKFCLGLRARCIEFGCTESASQTTFNFRFPCSTACSHCRTCTVSGVQLSRYPAKVGPIICCRTRDQYRILGGNARSESARSKVWKQHTGAVFFAANTCTAACVARSALGTQRSP